MENSCGVDFEDLAYKLMLKKFGEEIELNEGNYRLIGVMPNTTDL